MGINKNLSNSLFSKSLQNVLGLLYAHPEKDYYTNEIIRLANSGNGAVQRELTKLTNAGLIKMTLLGNQKRYQANREAPLFTELRSIVLKTFGLSDVINDAIKPLAKKIHIAFIYGSIAKQEDNANSDIDLMIITDQLTYAEVFKLLEKAEAQLGRPINPTFHSRAEWSKKFQQHNNFISQLIKQPKIFLIGTQDELAKLK